MNTIFIPKDYKQILDSYDMQRAISFIKQNFQSELAYALNLKRVSAPLFVTADSGLNDDLSGKERAVAFDIPAIGKDAQVVHSLAKWKRLALSRYGFKPYEGLYTDMNAIRRDEELDNLHSVYVDQWDWEKIIKKTDRNLDYLKSTVREIVRSICAISKKLRERFPAVSVELCDDVTFITGQELEDLYPSLTPEQRENEFTKIHKTVFVMQIGEKLKSGVVHSKRAPDYDDWSLNGDLLFWNDTLNRAVEISSMGIRVDEDALLYQLEKANCNHRKEFMFHKMLLDHALPLTIGGGIGQSRLCMLLIGCCHIGEVQSGIWDEITMKEAEKAGVLLL